MRLLLVLLTAVNCHAQVVLSIKPPEPVDFGAAGILLKVSVTASNTTPGTFYELDMATNLQAPEWDFVFGWESHETEVELIFFVPAGKEGYFRTRVQ